MKRADMRAGVLYAYRTGRSKAQRPTPMVVLDVDNHWAQRSHFGAKSRPMWQRKSDGGLYRSGPNVGRYNDNRHGYIAVGIGLHEWSPSGKDAIEPGRLLEITLADVAKITNHLTGLADRWPGVSADVIDPRYILGEWDEVITAFEGDRDVARAAYDAEQDRTVAAAAGIEAVWKRLRDLNLPGLTVPAPRPQFRRDYSGKGHYAGKWTVADDSVRLTAGQVDALLSLIPDGAVWTPDDVEDDGWTLRRPDTDGGGE